MVLRPPNLPRPTRARIPPEAPTPSVFNEPLPQNQIFGRHQHIVYDIQSSRPEQGHNVNGIGHLSSNTKIAALAFIAKLRGLEYIQQNQTALTRMMSQSHNDATIVEVARAMDYPGANSFRANFRPMTMRGGVLDRRNDNVVANAMPEATRRFFDTYRAALAKEQNALGITGSRIGDTSGRAEAGLRHGTSQASPLHVAHLVEYLYKLDDGKTLSQLANPTNRQHTSHAYLGNRTPAATLASTGDRPPNGHVFFAKTGTLDKEQYRRTLPPGSNVPQQYPNGVFVLTLGYIQDGKPKVAFFRADSSEQRKVLANRFLDDVAGVSPALVAQRRAAPAPTA